jgi:hypothetical protein
MKYEWMEHLMPRNIVIYRHGMVLVVGTVEDYMTVEHKVWEKQLVARGYDPTSWLVHEEDGGSPTREAEWQPYVFEGVPQPIAPLSLYLW